MNASPASAVREARRTLGNRLRELRRGAGFVTARAFAARAGWHESKSSRIENGVPLPSEEDIRVWARVCGVEGEVAELEHHATYLRSVEVMSVPGILQTEDYIRAMHRGAVPPLPDEEVDLRVEFRMKRRAIFEREAPSPFRVIIHEAALRMRFGGREVARGQLEFLLEASQWPTVSLRVLPFTCEDFIEATYPLVYAAGSVPQLDTVQMDSPVGGTLITAAAQLKKFAAMLDIAERSSLSESESRQLIRRIAREL
ncbi:helix-turn-helix domain-containing protein [Streptomyces prunicolor]